MNRMLVICTSALTVALMAFGAATTAGEFPGSSADPGNRIVCQDPFSGEYHQSPGLCAQAVGEFLTEQAPAYGPGFTGGPGEAFKYMRDYFGMDVSNAHDCIGLNCANHAGDL